MKQQNTEVPLHKINWFCIGYYAKIAAASTPICQVQDEIRVAHKMRQNCKLTFEWYWNRFYYSILDKMLLHP